MIRLWPVVALLALACSGSAWPPPPSTLAIDPAFESLERAAIEDALDHWCRAVIYCPRIVERKAAGQIVADNSAGTGLTTFYDGNPVIHLDRRELNRFTPAEWWYTSAHEIGHFGADHAEEGVMQPTVKFPYRGALCLDDAAVRLWCATQGCAFTRGTCDP